MRKPSQYMRNIKVNSAFHPFGVGKSSINLLSACLAEVKMGLHSPVACGR